MQQDDPHFRYRGREVTRLEAFSDVVFGFALTLIVIAIEVPRTFDDLMRDMRSFPGFAICFGILVWIWYCHHVYFRRYGLQDGYTVILNTVLLFLVLMYVYPLKFIFSAITGGLENPGLRGANASTVFLIYGVGFAGIFLVFALMYRHALRLREELGLSPAELVEAQGYSLMYIWYVVLGVISVVVALFANREWIGLAGWVYFLIGPVSGLLGYRMGNRIRRLTEPDRYGEAPAQSAP